MAEKDNVDTAFPFDLYGELEDAYDDAERNGDAEIMNTLDIFCLWNERPRTGLEFLQKIWLALQGNAEAQAEVGHAFYWTDDDPAEKREESKWLDNPELAAYWYELSAEGGCACAQNDLGNLYCPDRAPFGGLKLGRFARRWWEAAAAQKHPNGMRNLAHCLRCGKCCCCDIDVARAEELEKEIGQNIEKHVCEA